MKKILRNFEKKLDYYAQRVYNIIKEIKINETVKEEIKMAMIYKANAESIENKWDWDTTLANNAIDIVEEFDNYEDAVKAFDEGGYDEDLYGVF